ncbi:sodium-coupled monocarboxylate transporter 1 [Patella vulgata]|uniref:sodium-coupled monocarboxylate transporter 1 n=1 Tax=Patella vulgata TaxID=6465 RepID=UPI0021800EAF|nr:sodium-coupled monocarboxylate transporter 1 [Patella vulgata]
MATVNRFGWPDYVVLASVPVISLMIGLYQGLRRRKQTTEDYLMGGRDMSFLPVAFSVLASFLSAISVLGAPVEIYVFGASFWVNALSYFISVPITAHVFIPLFFKLKITSAYEYLELRFNRVIRLLGCFVFTIQMVFYMAVVFYAPALAFSHVSGLSLWVSVLAVGAACTIYTSIGGLRAVIWTDFFQVLVVISGLLALVIKGTMDVGGLGTVWEKAREGGRLNMFSFDPDPRHRHTVWSLIIGGAVTTLSVYAVNQAMVQRYLCVKNQRTAQATIYFNLPGNIITTTILTLLGLVAYAKYKDCDPLYSGKITQLDQLVPFMVLETLGVLPGLAGLFVACVFSAALSTVSSGVNALALVYLEDVVKPIYKMKKGNQMADGLASFVSKGLALFFGALTIGLAFLSSLMGRTILHITLSSFGMTGGPLLALFILAMFFPTVNSWGVGVGLISSLVFSFWLGIGTIISRPPLPILSLKTSECPITQTVINNITQSVEPFVTSTIMYDVDNNMTSYSTGALEASTAAYVSRYRYTGLEIYRVSYMWYSSIAVIVGISVALMVSCVSGGQKNPINPALIIPVWRNIQSLFGKKSKSLEITKHERLQLKEST